QTRDGLGELEAWIEIRVLRAAAVPRKPTRVHGELHEVGESSDLPGPCRFTAGQSAKLIQIDWVCALRNQVGVDELEVGELILGVVVDILGHVLIQLFQGSDVRCTSPSDSWDFVVLDS